MADKTYAKFHEQGQGRALIELAKQYPPKDAIREFVTNSLDARVPGTTEDISVSTNPRERRVIISDNGAGMDYQHLCGLSENIGFSAKAGNIDMRGEKALGLLAFGSLGNVMHIITRPYDGSESGYGYSRWEIDQPKSRIPVQHQKIDARSVEKDFYGNFPNGTRIIIDQVDSHVMEKLLALPILKTWLRELYNPALKKSIADIRLGRLDRRTGEMRAESLEPINYEKGSSTELVNGTMPIEIKGEDVPGNLEVLLYVDPEAISDKVVVYSKDVLVYPSLAELTEFGRSPVWTSGKVSGYVNDHFNRLILGRSGIDRNRNAFKEWYNAIRRIEAQIKPIVDEKRKHGKRLIEDGSIRKAFNVLADIWRDIKETAIGGEYTRSERGEVVTVKGVTPRRTEESKEKEKEGEKEKKEPKIPKIPPRPAGPGNFTYDPGGILQKVAPKGGIPFGCPQPIRFPQEELHLRSKLEDMFGKPTALINSEHPDYKARIEQKDNNIFTRYVLELMAKEIARFEVRRADKEGTLLGSKSDIVNTTLEREEYIRFLALQRLGIR